MSRAELVAQLRSLEARLQGDAERQALLHELQVHQAELEAQQAQLIETQEALQQSRDRYADLFDLAPVGYVTMDTNGVIEAINLAGLRLLNLRDRSRVLGTPFTVFVDADDRPLFRLHLMRCRDTLERVETELTLRAYGTGDTIQVRLCSRRAAAPANPELAYPTSLIDMSALRRAEADRRAAEEKRRAIAEEDRAIRALNDAKDRFLAALSHELRTPLTPILLTLDVMEARGDLPPPVRETCRMIRRNAETEARLIDDLLDVSRIANDKLRCEMLPLDLHDVLRDVAAMYAEEAKSTDVALHLELNAGEHHVLGDVVRLRQVFWNLLRNALRHTPRGGRIVLQTHNPSPRTMCVNVVDNGRGIPPDLLGRIFEPFEQVDKRASVGLGLGLAISKGLVERHAGGIFARSGGVGRGAEFTVELPTTARPVEPRETVIPRARARTNGTTVLLVEDHRDTAEAMGIALTAAGYQVVIGHSVQEALDKATGAVDIVVSDINLPDGSGLDLMRQLLSQRPTVGIALSGYGTEEDVEASRSAGFQRHLVKPVELGQLLATLEELTTVV